MYMIHIKTCAHAHVMHAFLQGWQPLQSIPIYLSTVLWMLEPKRPKHPRARDPTSHKLEPNWPQAL